MGNMRDNQVLIAAARDKFQRMRSWIVRNLARQKSDDEIGQKNLRLLIDDIAAEGHVDPAGKWGLSKQGHFILQDTIEQVVAKHRRGKALKGINELEGDLNAGWPDNDGDANDGFDAVDGPASFENEANLGDVFKRAESMRGLDRNGNHK